jgi:hypothetical protein
MCTIDEYAMIFFISSCTKVINPAYIILAILNVIINALKYIDAFGKSGNKKRSIPYVAIFNNIPARRIEPLVGASTCASGNHP